VLPELVTNAVKYGPEHEAFELIVATGDRTTRFIVHGLGLGPLPEMREPTIRLRAGTASASSTRSRIAGAPSAAAPAFGSSSIGEVVFAAHVAPA
jgi:hypothetical protein